MGDNIGNIKKTQPIRRCIGCGEHFPKKELIRIVKSPIGEIFLDETGKKNGRGAYICKNAACMKKARKSKRIDAAFECSISEEIYDKLTEELEGGR